MAGLIPNTCPFFHYKLLVSWSWVDASLGLLGRRGLPKTGYRGCGYSHSGDERSAQKRPEEQNRHLRLIYAFKFASIISPGSLANFRLLVRDSGGSSIRRNSKLPTISRKLYLKQSYILLTWFAYLRKSQEHPLITPTDPPKDKVPLFFILPKKKRKFTILKAPMAHKTFSQEQYLFSFYFCCVSYNMYYRESDPSDA